MSGDVAPPRHPVLLITGLRREARIIGSDGIGVIVGGGCSTRLAQDLERAAIKGAKAFLSMGIAGGLRPGLPSGTTIIASSVVTDGARMATTTAWSERLHQAIPGSLMGDLAGSDRIIAGLDDKAALFQATHADAVDMESHVAALVAGRHGIPFAALRIIADPAERSLPPAAQAGMRDDGRVDLVGVARSLLAAPGQIPALMRTAADARRAFAALSRCRLLIGPGLCFPDFGELLLDMP
jgi:hopanoid-associated phosphorylase